MDLVSNADPLTTYLVCPRCFFREELFEGDTSKLRAPCLPLCSHEFCSDGCRFCGGELLAEGEGDADEFEKIWDESDDVSEYEDEADPKIDDMPEEAFL